MKKLCAAFAILVLMTGCGGGGGGAVSAPAPPAPYVVITPSAQTNVDQGQSVKFAASVENDSSGKGVTWSVAAAGLTGSACGTLENTTTTGATFDAPTSGSGNVNVTVTATSIADPAVASSATVTVSRPPVITTTTLVNATPNANYSATLQASGGVGTLTWSLVSGSLPTGLALSNSGVISGVPTASATSNFTVQVIDSSGAAGGAASMQAQLALTVVTAVSMGTTALPAGSQGVTYLCGVQAGGGTPPYTWSVTSGSLPAGLTIETGSGVISGTPTTQGIASFTVAVQDSSPTRQTATEPLTITIGAPGPLAITTSGLLNATVDTPYTAAVAATGGSPPYQWSIVAGALPAGMSLTNSTGSIAGTPSAAGTASFTVMAQDSSSPPQMQTQSLNLTVNNAAQACSSTGNNAVLNGQYAFTLSGFNDLGFLTVVGSFTADGTGKITAGEADTNGVLGAQHGNLIAAASTYSVGPDHRGCAVLATSFGTFATHFALASLSSNVAANGRMIEWDSPATGAFIAAGELLRQTPGAFASGMAGGYTFRTLGWDPYPLGGRDACAGAISAAGSTFRALEQDCNDAWNISTLQSPDTAGTYTSFDSNGRATAIITLGDSNFNWTFYAVSNSQLLVVNSDAGIAAGGEWVQQNAPSGGFTAASLAGNMVFYMSGLSLNGTATAVSMETATADGASSLAINFYEDRAGVMQASGTLVCSYAVQPNGRVALSSTSESCGSAPPVVYLTAANTGFILDASPGVDTGFIEPQAAGPFTNASISGTFAGGTTEVTIAGAQPEVVASSTNGSSEISGATDATSLDDQQDGSPFLPSTYGVNSDGSFSLDPSNSAMMGIIISPTKFVIFSPLSFAGSYPTLLVMQQ